LNIYNFLLQPYDINVPFKNEILIKGTSSAVKETFTYLNTFCVPYANYMGIVLRYYLKYELENTESISKLKFM